MTCIHGFLTREECQICAEISALYKRTSIRSVMERARSGGERVARKTRFCECSHPKGEHDEDGCYHANDHGEFTCECRRFVPKREAAA